MLKLLIIALAVTVVSCQFSSFFNRFFCRRIEREDCSIDKDDFECGQNGVTYRNRCEFTQARCKGVNTQIAHEGKCTTTSNLNQTLPGFDGDQAALDYLCVKLSHEDCPTTVDRVCGNDGMTYENLCEYEKQKCTHRDLHIKKLGSC